MTPEERKEEVRAAQQGKSREEIMAEMERKSESVVDLDNLASVEHNWVKRGIKVSCEHAGHPHHSHFLIRPR